MTAAAAERQASPATPPERPALQGLLAHSALRDGRGLAAAVIFAVLGCTVLQRFGITLGSASLHIAVLGMYVLLTVAAFSGQLAVHRLRAVLVAALLGLAGLSLVINDSTAFAGQSSPLSWVLLGVMYLPFAFVLRGPTIDTAFLLRVFGAVTVWAAWAGIAQFALQFVYQADWLFNFSPYLPSVLRSADGYNVVIAVGERVKSNGFFFKEPSLFSVVMALGLLLELATHEEAHRRPKPPLAPLEALARSDTSAGAGRRWWRLAPLALALMLTYSGSGLLVLAVGLLFPLRLATFVRMGAAALIGGAVIWALWDVLNLGFTLGRVSEFTNPRSSAYERYVGPLRLLSDSMASGSAAWTAWIGHGPGTITRLGDTTFYTFHDPTWAKATFEYGLLGLAMVVSLAVLSLRNAAVPIQLRVGVFACWFVTGGFLLTPEALYLMPLLSGLVIAQRPASA